MLNTKQTEDQLSNRSSMAVVVICLATCALSIAAIVTVICLF